LPPKSLSCFFWGFFYFPKKEGPLPAEPRERPFVMIIPLNLPILPPGPLKGVKENLYPWPHKREEVY
jgi:hypothetical protein